MAYWLSCLFLAYCSSILTVPVVARSLSFPEKAFHVNVHSDPLAPLRKEALVVGKGANEPDPDSAESEFRIHEHVWSETFWRDEERAQELEYLQEPKLAFGEDTESTNPGLVLDGDESSISTVLSQNGLPIGLLPSCVKSYTLSEAGKFSVSLEETCYVDFDYEVYYSQTITGTLSYGTISDLSGIQAKKAFLWLAVTGIRIDASSSSYIYFDVGPISKRLSIAQFEMIPACKANAIYFSALARRDSLVEGQAEE